MLQDGDSLLRSPFLVWSRFQEEEKRRRGARVARVAEARERESKKQQERSNGGGWQSQDRRAYNWMPSSAEKALPVEVDQRAQYSLDVSSGRPAFLRPSASGLSF
jgi:hypothetical protein